MNVFTILAIVIGLLVISGIAITGVVMANNSTSTGAGQQTICQNCGNGCTKEKNCGLATCRAISGGKCGCNG